ncbi:MAG: dipeptidase [Chlorobi bacterium]|nr:dipeptidase [Chlorobiota bacterium]
MPQKTLHYIDTNLDQFIGELKDFLRIPSISARQEYGDDVRKGAEWVKKCAEDSGLENATIYDTHGHPVVYADWLHAEEKPTVLIYGHYDVQPPEPLELWTSPPFEPDVRGDDIYARGAVDDKGQVHLHLKGIEAWMKTHGKLPVNVKLILEGEEEVGSPNLEPFVLEHADLLSCDAVMISDTPMYDYDMPSITYGLRGLAYFELLMAGPDRDLHSGMFGGVVANPLNALCGMIARMKDENGRIQLPGFYDDVIDVSPEEREEFERLPYSEEEFEKRINIPDTVGEEGYTDLERLWARPALDVCGIWGGYQGEGAKTVLPAKAGAKVSMRLVANQDYHKVEEQFRQFVEENTPPGVTVEVKDLYGGPPVLTPTDSKAVKAALAALEEVFETVPYLTRNGASIPIVADFEKNLKVPVVLMGFGLPDQNAHAPDERLNLKNYHRGIKSAALFLERFGTMEYIRS